MVTMYGLVYTDKAKEQYEALDARLRRQVDKGLERIRQNPQLGKPLRGELKGIWSERVATFRILYKIRNKEVEVVILVIEHRKSVYGGH
jgi:mRNA interferase RelE/StbE